MGGLLKYTNAIVGMGLVGVGIAMIASPELVVPEMYGKKKNGQRVKGEPATAWVAIGCFEFFMGVVLCMSFYWGKNVRFGLGAMYLCLMCALMYDLSQNATKSGLAPFGLNNFTYNALIWLSCWYAVALTMNRLEPGYVTNDKKRSTYVVDGEKKWITNGVWADYFTVAVRTGGPGMGGISLLLIEKTMPGVICRRMDCMGVWASGTSFITFENVKVPVGNLIGAENQGFKYVMHNFNHERWGFVVQANRFARVCYEEAFKYAHRRRTFGKKLVEHPVIRAKLADMVRQIDATHHQMENITYQMCTLPKDQSAKALAGITALAKVQSTKVFEYCAREAAQIFGGASYVRGGQGEKVERLYRDVRAYAIPGGSEEIMMDLGIRQAMKEWEAVQSRM